MKIAILGYGNIGRAAEEAIKAAPDMELAGIYHHNDCLDCIDADVVLVCTPTREVQKFATVLATRGICTVDSFDIHDRLRAAQMRPGFKRVREVFLEGVADVGHAGDAALRHLRVAVVDGAFRDDADGSGVMFREHEGGGKPRKTAAYDQMVKITFLSCLHFFRPKSQKRFSISTNMI